MENEKIQKALDRFLKNPYWSDIYNNASDLCKRFYEQHFAFSLNVVDGEEHIREVEEIYRAFTPSDWDYIINHTKDQMSRWGYEQARAKYETRK